jgi:hypothetical protein
LREQFRRAGVTDETSFAADLDALPPDEVEVWEWQVPAVEAFLAAATQWRHATQPAGMGSMSRPCGLDYAACRVAWDLSGLTLTPEDFEGVQTIEAATLEVIRGD